MPVKLAAPALYPPIRPNVGWYPRWAVDTFVDVPSDEEERRAYRRRLGANLGRIRSQLTDFTQETIADALGMDAETYGRWERGTREPKAFDLHRLADKFGVPADWLLDPTDSFTELDRRIAQLRRAAVEAAQADVAAEQARRGAGAAGARRGKR